ncbi:MAG: rhomboid family intramembrane serine protease, partial [Planctomycetales bacterium]|nr:rhomboid family intramembrane serine protease [Planctomycetales bacterium]
ESDRSNAPKTMVTKLIIVNVAIYIADFLLGAKFQNGTLTLCEFLAVPADLFSHPWDAWRLLTAAFAHAPMSSDSGLWHIAINMYMLWMLGNPVEQKYGGQEFLRLYLALAVLASCVWVLVEQLAGWSNLPPIMYGASGATTGITILFVMNFPHVRFAFPPLPAWAIGLLVVGMDVLRAMSGDDSVAYAAHLGGAFFAFLYFRSGMRLSKFSLPGSWKKIARPRPKLSIHNPEETYAELDRQADEILEKVNKNGVDSISAKERRILDDYARRMRQKHR